jgi:HSP20 family molecular chaperone IbpA
MSQTPLERTIPVDVKESGTEYSVKFVTRFVTPADVDATRVRAEFHDGVLNVHVPKTGLAKAGPIGRRVA